MILLRNLAWSLALLPTLIAPTAARAAMATFSFVGADDDDPYITATGTLSFNYANGKTTLGLGDITGFRFAYTVTSADPSFQYSDVFTFGQSDLTSFAATATSTGQVTALSLRTGFESSATDFLAPQFVVVSALGRNGVETFFGTGRHDDALGGTLTPSVVPEPGSLALLGIAAGLGLIGHRLRRRG